METPKLEIACFNLQSAKIADANGADRIELCDDLCVGGITPPLNWLEGPDANFNASIVVMIRPRGGDFVYSEIELEQMRTSIRSFKEMNIDGFVFGVLNPDQTVNISQNKELIKLAHPLPCTFHRAFDRTQDPSIALQHVIDCGFKTILTSGHADNAVDGMKTLSELTTMAKGRITIMPGGGVRSSNIKWLKEKIPAPWFHSSAVKRDEIADPEEIKLLKSCLK